MRYALIGCGMISPNHINAALANDLEIVALCDLVEENRNKALALIPEEKREAPQRQANANDEEKTRTMNDNRIGLTEEQVKLEASRCLGCGATVVDEKKCIGCGICTTRCKFDAIHLNRTHPEFANYINGDYAKQALIKHQLKRVVKLTIKEAGKKITRHVEV